MLIMVCRNLEIAYDIVNPLVKYADIWFNYQGDDNMYYTYEIKL